MAVVLAGAAVAGCGAEEAGGGLGPGFAPEDVGPTALLEGVLRTDGPECWWIEHQGGTTLVAWSSDFEFVEGAIEGPTSTGKGATRRIQAGDAVGLGGGERANGADDFAEDCGPRPIDAFDAHVIAG